MSIRVLIVDDSSFFRRIVRSILAKDATFELIGEAKNGAEAVEMATRLKPDVITMDVEMPVMGGIAAVGEILARVPAKILMLSSLTQKGAQFTLDALNAGAVDFLTKDIRGSEIVSDNFTDALLTKLRQIHHLSVPQLKAQLSAADGVPSAGGSARVGTSARQASAHNFENDSLLLIGASTGGPAALQKVIPCMPGNFPVPVVIIQHMPAGFTSPFARRLDEQSEISVCHAEDGMTLLPRHAYVAPGGMQLTVANSGGQLRSVIREPNAEQIYRPCIDIALSSAAASIGRGACAIIMTGMGADGREGARALKREGAKIWAQDEASSVIYGMPMAVAKAGLVDEILSLDRICQLLGRERG
ncbi:MAG: chemotaxis-specific protein-glutamate methyltransferase CheB [Gammaproteobacteria bacterium]|nr:chemotaxis-specific protein-glutamate methyltransferase CheB [Gammaproteobacteria bacterium]